MEKLTTIIEKVVYGGKGLGTQGEKKVFIPNTFTGDHVSYEVTKDQKNFLEGKVLQTLKESPHRTTSPCIYSDECGGCQWLSIKYKSQTEAKSSFIEEAFTRLGKAKLKSSVPVTPSVKNLSYRNRILLRGTYKKGKIHVGFFKKDSHTQVPVEKCLIAHEAHNKLISFINALTLPKERTQKFRLEIQVQPELFQKKEPCLLITLFPIERNHDLEAFYDALNSYSDTLFLSYSNGKKEAPFFLFEKDNSLDYYGKAGTFQQINTETNALLRKKVEEITKSLNPKKILDLYCGSGNLSLSLIDGEREVIGVELNKESIKVASHNLKMNHLIGGKYFAMSAEKYLSQNTSNSQIDLLILDPPRKGAKDDIPHIRRMNPKHILYISCDPSTAARDFKSLSDLYQLELLEGFDFFPQTYHIETLFLLKKTT